MWEARGVASILGGACHGVNGVRSTLHLGFSVTRQGRKPRLPGSRPPAGSMHDGPAPP